MLKVLLMPWLVLVMLTGAANASAAPRLPERLFACHILNAEGEAAIVHVQADNAERARAVARDAPVSGTSSDRSAVQVAVVECIEPGRERFRDKEVRSNADSLLQ